MLEDWIWHAALPILAYAAMVPAGVQLARVSTDALFIVGGSALLLVFIGIHNAWDTVTYVMLERARAPRSEPLATVIAERPLTSGSTPAASAIAERTPASEAAPFAGTDVAPAGPSTPGNR